MLKLQTSERSEVDISNAGLKVSCDRLALLQIAKRLMQSILTLQ